MIKLNNLTDVSKYNIAFVICAPLYCQFEIEPAMYEDKE